MLRRKLLLRLGVLVGVLVVAAVGAIWMLQGVLRDLDEVNRDAAALVDGAQELAAAVTSVEGDLYASLLGRAPGPAGTAEQAARARAAYSSLGSHPLMLPPSETAGVYAHAGGLLESLLGGAAGPGPADRSLADSAALRADLLALTKAARTHVTTERAAVVSRLRWMVLGMSLAALAVVNLAVLLLLRTADMVLRPVDALVEASRQLAQERFDHRVDLDGHGEFGELARAYNSLAAQLATNEQRKVETLQQTALMLNHELNNVLAIIGLQMTLAGRHASDNPLLKQHLSLIKTSLTRMTETVGALGRIRRIILTDYLPGQKMLDLPASVAPDEPPPAPAPAKSGAAP